MDTECTQFFFKLVKNVEFDKTFDLDKRLERIYTKPYTKQTDIFASILRSKCNAVLTTTSYNRSETIFRLNRRFKTDTITKIMGGFQKIWEIKRLPETTTFGDLKVAARYEDILAMDSPPEAADENDNTSRPPTPTPEAGMSSTQLQAIVTDSETE